MWDKEEKRGRVSLCGVQLILEPGSRSAFFLIFFQFLLPPSLTRHRSFSTSFRREKKSKFSITKKTQIPLF
jgi:hypothetical protein